MRGGSSAPSPAPLQNHCSVRALNPKPSPYCPALVACRSAFYLYVLKISPSHETEPSLPRPSSCCETQVSASLARWSADRWTYNWPQIVIYRSKRNKACRYDRFTSITTACGQNSLRSRNTQCSGNGSTKGSEQRRLNEKPSGKYNLSTPATRALLSRFHRRQEKRRTTRFWDEP